MSRVSQVWNADQLVNDPPMRTAGMCSVNLMEISLLAWPLWQLLWQLFDNKIIQFLASFWQKMAVFRTAGCRACEKGIQTERSEELFDQVYSKVGCNISNIAAHHGASCMSSSEELHCSSCTTVILLPKRTKECSTLVPSASAKTGFKGGKNYKT